MTAGNFAFFLPLLKDHGIDFVLVGGGAAIAHGAARATYDVGIVYGRDPANLERLVEALGGLEPYLRGAPAGLPFRFDTLTLARGLNFTLTTTRGDLDLLGEVTGGGSWEQLAASTRTVSFYGRDVPVVTLEKLIELKRAAGRPKDFEAIAELESLRDARDNAP